MRATLTKLLGGIALAVALPALLLLLFEGGLRLFGYGYDDRFSRSVTRPDGSRHEERNPTFTRPFFAEALLRWAPWFSLPVDKPVDETRIFVFGGSAAMGDPEPAYSPARALEVMLRAQYPERAFNVVNAAMTATNSHVALQAARDALALEPDLYVVYVGNNEVIGPFGPTAVLTPALQTPGAIAFHLTLKELRLVQLIDAMLYALAGGDDQFADWGGMEMFLDHRLPADDPRLDTVYANYRYNLRTLVDEATAAGVPVILCTVPVNLRDFAPFASTGEPLPDPAVTVADEGYLEALADRAEAHPDHAYAQFTYAEALLAAGENEAAADRFRRARDLDTLRFRADARLNATVRDVATETGAPLYDAEVFLAHASDQGLPGDALFWEHVHLTPKGTYEFVRGLLPVVASALALPTPGEPLELAALHQRLGFTVGDQVRLHEQMISRLGRAPFVTQPGNAERRGALGQMHAIFQQMAQQPAMQQQARATYEAALGHRPEDWWLLTSYGDLLSKLGETREAHRVLAQTIALYPRNDAALLSLAYQEFAYGSITRGDELVAEALAINPYQEAPQLEKGRALVRGGRLAEAAPVLQQVIREHPRQRDAYLLLADVYFRQQDLRLARGIVREAIHIYPEDAPLHFRLGLLYEMDNRLEQARTSVEAAVALDPNNESYRTALRRLGGEAPAEGVTP